MNAKFVDIHSAADYIGPGAVEVPSYQSEIQDAVQRRGIFGRRIKSVPATGHPSRFFDGGIERSVPLKALVTQINYNLFDIELNKTGQFKYLQARDLSDSVESVLRTHDVALWNGHDTGLHSPTSPEYYGAAGQIAAGKSVTIPIGYPIHMGLQSQVALMAIGGARPTAIYANPVLLDLLEREHKAFVGMPALGAEDISGFRFKTLSTAAGILPLIPDWTLAYTGTPGQGSAVLPAYIVTEDLIEYHWLSDPNPRVFQLESKGSLCEQHVVLKFGAIAVKGVGKAHVQVLVER